MKYNSIKKQKGLTLLELMIAVALGIFITAGMIQLFINSKQNYRVQESLSRLQENGRFAMGFIARDIRMASYWGCLQNGLDNTTNGLDPAGTNYDINYHGFGQGIVGLNGAANAPDTLTLRGAFGNGIAIIAPLATLSSGTLTVPTNNGLIQGDIVMVSDCQKADIFQITNANPSATGQLIHAATPPAIAGIEPGNANIADPTCTAPAQCLSKIYINDAAIYKISTIAYSIQNGASGEPALFRKINGGNDNELIEGVEDMQILYGEDTDNDGTPNYYLPAGSAGLNMDQVVSIRVSLLARTLDDNIATQAVPYTIFGVQTIPADLRIRRVFTSTIAVRNRLP
jgi:type IV pilus assembly protein PilW